MNFLAIGVKNPSCFDEPLDFDQIKRIRLTNFPQLSNLMSIASYARKQNMNEEWLQLLETRIAKGLTPNRETISNKVIAKLSNAVRLAMEGKWDELWKKILSRVAAE